MTIKVEESMLIDLISENQKLFSENKILKQKLSSLVECDKEYNMIEIIYRKNGERFSCREEFSNLFTFSRDMLHIITDELFFKIEKFRNENDN